MATSALSRLQARAEAKDNGEGREVEIPLEKIVFDPDQPRKGVDPESIQEMAASLDTQGQIQAITVQELSDGNYMIVVGERRTRGQMYRRDNMDGPTTIRAKIRNDLTDRTKRLVFQAIENIQREDLNDRELAALVTELMKDTPTGGSGMNHREVAEALGKKEAWVTRYVRFADEALQAKWVETGILDTVEKVYRVSVLPANVQEDIVRRVALPEGDEEHLAIPLNRSVIDALSREVKSIKVLAKMAQEHAADNAGDPSSENDTAPQGTPPDEFQSALMSAADAGQTGASSTQSNGRPSTQAAATKAPPQPPAAGGVTGGGGYQLPEAARQKILQSAPSEVPPLTSGAKDDVVHPVTCKLETVNLVALMRLVKSEKDIRELVGELKCSVTIPGPLVITLAQALNGGKRVQSSQASAMLQDKLSKLR